MENQSKPFAGKNTISPETAVRLIHEFQNEDENAYALIFVSVDPESHELDFISGTLATEGEDRTGMMLAAMLLKYLRAQYEDKEHIVDIYEKDDGTVKAEDVTRGKKVRSQVAPSQVHRGVEDVNLPDSNSDSDNVRKIDGGYL